jgi:ABC-type Fe3+ transport system permease subunit
MMDRRTRAFFLIGLLVAIVCGVVVSQFASSNPDGLEYVAEQKGFIDTAQDHALSDFALADYGDGLTDNSTLNTAVAGLLGTVVTLIAGYGVFWLARRTRARDEEPQTTHGP